MDTDLNTQPDTKAHPSMTHSFRCPSCSGDYHALTILPTGDIYVCTSGAKCTWSGPASECFTVPRLVYSKGNA